MYKFIDFTVDMFDYVLEIQKWPLWLRRLFVILLPISFPFWVLSVVIAISVTFLVAVLDLICKGVKAVFDKLIELWE